GDVGTIAHRNMSRGPGVSRRPFDGPGGFIRAIRSTLVDLTWSCRRLAARGKSVEVGDGKGLAAASDEELVPIFAAADKHVERAPQLGTIGGARRVDWKWRLSAMVEVDRGERDVVIKPWLRLA